MNEPKQAATGNVLASLLDAADDAIITTDLDATIRSWNGSAARLYGYTAEEMVGQSMTRLLPEAQQAIVPANFARIRTGQRVEHFETVRVTKDGQLIEVSATLSPIRDDAGTPVGALSMSRDIRGRKRQDAALLVSQARWHALIESAVDGIVMIDDRGRIEAFNGAAERLFGYVEREVLGKNVHMLMPSPYRDEHDGYLARYQREGNARIIGIGRDVVGRRKDGTTFPLHLAVGEMSLEGERKFTGILHDLSSRVQLEEQMREQSALAKLGEMAAVIAHEVKNPLAGIRGAIQVIGSRLDAASPETEITREIVARIDALNRLIQDLLTFSRPPQPHPTQVDVAALIKATAELFGADPALGAIQVELTGSAPTVTADAGLLKIVLGNLLDNAAHAMKGSGTIRVSVGADDDRCSVVVRDTGAGMAPDVLDKAFNPFFTTKSRGTGLGLPTARRLVEAQGGSVRIECPPGGGTTVTVELPLHG